MNDSNQEKSQDRRIFMLSVIYGLWGGIAAILAAPAAIYLLWPPKVKKEDEWVEATALSDLDTGTPKEIVFRRNRLDGWKLSTEKTSAWVVKNSESQITAFKPQCPHLGCGYHWNAQNKEFLCPCHASTFSVEGDVLTGPAPRPLDRYETKIAGEKLLLRSFPDSHKGAL